MAVILQMTYQKKLGLPNYSSHSCAVSLTTEIADVSAVADESTRLYGLLQDAVDREIQSVGFMPDASTYGMKTNGNGHPIQNGNGNGNGHPSSGNGNAQPPTQNRRQDRWNCTEGQQGLILRIVNENQLNKDDVEAMAQQFFGCGVKECDKLQASQIIEELLAKTGQKGTTRRRWSPRQPARS